MHTSKYLIMFCTVCVQQGVPQFGSTTDAARSFQGHGRQRTGMAGVCGGIELHLRVWQGQYCTVKPVNQDTNR